MTDLGLLEDTQLAEPSFHSVCITRCRDTGIVVLRLADITRVEVFRQGFRNNFPSVPAFTISIIWASWSSVIPRFRQIPMCERNIGSTLSPKAAMTDTVASSRSA